jgi:threonine dehydrogenase-like Zn-dependent dehydrogenase
LSDTTLALRLNGSESIRHHSSDGPVTRNLAVEEVTLTEPLEGEVVVDPIYTGVCGSDVHASLGAPNFSWVERPRTIGHEFSGRIVGFGPNTEGWSGFELGDLVTAVPQRGCHDPRCRGCRQGRWNYCRNKTIFGFHRDGAFARRAVLEIDRLVPIREGVTPLQGSVIEPLSVVTQAIYSRCEIKPGMDVVVTGCGIIGLMAAELAKACGARVAITGLEQDREIRLKAAAERGMIPIVVGPDRPLHDALAEGIRDEAGNLFGDQLDNGTVDVLIECSGAPPVLGAAPYSVRTEGTICVVATYASDAMFAATALTRGGLTMTGVMGSGKDDFEVAQRLLRDGVFPVEHYARIYPFEQVIDAFADSIQATVSKAILEVNPQ